MRELGKALNMNWAYGVEFLEVVPNNWARTHLMIVRLRRSSNNCNKSSPPTKNRLRALYGIIAGDMNTTGPDSTPTSIENMLYNRYGSLDFWTTKGVQWATGVGMVYTGAKAAMSLSGIQYRIDPTSGNIPGVSAILERVFISTLEKFRFADGTSIDFRGIWERTVNGTAGTLADSNLRQGAGFKPTFAAELIWGNVKLAKFMLDWLFVKADVDMPRDARGPYQFAPHFARTLVNLNNCPPELTADHSPMTVDLPFNEPRQLSNKEKAQ